MIAEAAAAGIANVKMYPQGKTSPPIPAEHRIEHLSGVTTNSASGVTNLDDFYPVFEAMEKVSSPDLKLHIQKS